jgi:hypothetical protein
MQVGAKASGARFGSRGLDFLKLALDLFQIMKYKPSQDVYILDR